MTTRRYLCIIRDQNGICHEFQFDVHRTEPGETRCMERQYYRKYTGAEPVGVHHEMELVVPDDIVDAARAPVHLHRMPDGRKFICFTGTLVDEPEMLNAMWNWCCGTVYTLTAHKDFVPLAQNCGDKMLDYLEELGIKLESIEVVINAA